LTFVSVTIRAQDGNVNGGLDVVRRRQGNVSVNDHVDDHAVIDEDFVTDRQTSTLTFSHGPDSRRRNDSTSYVAVEVTVCRQRSRR
jgi:hypothetical protein